MSEASATDPTPPDARSTTDAPRRLRRSREDRLIFGVCGGLGRYFGIDPVLVRIVFVLLVIFGASGVLLYLIGLIAIPSAEPGTEPATATRPFVSASPAVIFGAVLVSAGILLLLARMVPALGELFGPLLLIALGVAVIAAARR
jgi:phage shock protein C